MPTLDDCWSRDETFVLSFSAASVISLLQRVYPGLMIPLSAQLMDDKQDTLDGLILKWTTRTTGAEPTKKWKVSEVAEKEPSHGS
jgi:hypothetical protein